jgi:hypothetical protein
LKVLFKGLKRIEVEEKCDGSRPIDEGKSALPFSLYCWIALQFWKNGDSFSLLYLVFSWNLMARTNNTAMLRLRNLEWSDDALLVYFSKTKGDQEGAFSKDPKFDLLTAWLLCFEGNKNEGLTPYRMLEGRDLSSIQQRKTLSDWKVVMKTLAQELDGSEEANSATTDTLCAMFREAARAVTEKIQHVSSRGRKRRVDQLHISYVRKLLKADTSNTEEEPTAIR